MPERPVTPHGEATANIENRFVDAKALGKIDLRSNIPPHIAQTSSTGLPFYVSNPDITLRKLWNSVPNSSYHTRDIWRNDDIEQEWHKTEHSDSCGVPKRELDPRFIKLWKHVGLNNPWLILKMWEEFHQNNNEDALIWLDGCGAPERTINWKELIRKAFKLAIYLRENDAVQAGDRIILCYPPGIDFVVAFLACLFGGFIAVPVYPPTPANQTRDGDRFLDIRKNAGVRIILTNRMYLRVARLMFRLWRGGDSSDPEVRALGVPTWLPVEDSDVISDEQADNFVPATVYPWTTAFLQFTSGSTSQPKGVVVTHGSLLHNVHICGKGFGMPTHLDDPTRVGEANFDSIELTEYAAYMQHRHTVSAVTQGHPARVFSWLPVYHDMGLIGGLMTPLFGGCQLYQMSPVDFIKKPDLWMQSMSDYRCSCCAAPNFAFELAVKRTSDSQVRSMSLAHLAGIICGAEPIRPSTMNKFFTKFSQAGLRDDVIIPAFGLAENTLIVSCRDNASERPKVLAIDAEKFRRDSTVVPVPFGVGSNNGSRPRTPTGERDYRGMIDLDVENAEWLDHNATDNDDTVMTLVGCGKAAHEVDVRIVDHKTMKEVPQGVVGEVWFQSSSTARGYYRLPEKTKEDFSASCIYLDGTKSKEYYMRSGDTGFLFENELFICGRLKDMLVVRGKNYYPQDIEGVLDTIPELRAGCSIAISTEDPSNEELCIAAELRDNCFAKNWTGQNLLSSIFPVLSPTRVISPEISEGFHSDEEFYEFLSKKMAKLVQAQVGISVSRVFLLKGRSMAKTTSGKVRRHAARTALLNESKRAPGLLYTSTINNEDSKPSKTPIDEVVLRETWPDEEEEYMEALVSELLKILIDTVPSTSLPRVDIGLNADNATTDTKSRKLIREFFDKAVFELGMDSPSMVEFGERIRRRLDPGFDVFQPELIINCPTIAHLISFMGRKIRGNGEMLSLDQTVDDTTIAKIPEELIEKMVTWAIRVLVEHRDDIDAGEYQVDPVEDTKILCDRIQVSPAACYPVSRPSDWTKVMLTGCTGFLGQWQLRYLLELYPRCEVSCIIRADDVESAWERMLKTVNGEFFEMNKHRIELIPGDITKINFGLDSNLYDSLCSKIKVVIHTAANINLFTSYNRLRKTNVLATVRLIEFCSTVQLKPLNFASTLGIFPAYFALWKDHYSDHVVEEGSRPNAKEMMDIFPPTAMGYPWTKLACEKILERAHNQGLPVTVYRYPLTCMCYENGHTQTDNVMIPLTLAAIQEGIIPRNFIMNANTPSDIAARNSIIVAMSGVTIDKTSEPWLNRGIMKVMDTVGLSMTPPPETSYTDKSVESMPCLHMCDPVKVTGNKLSVWLSELGVPIDLVDDPLTLLEAAQVRGETSALREIIHLTRSPVARFWFGNKESLAGLKDLPIITSFARSKIAAAWQCYSGPYPKPESLWPAPRELFKRSFLFMIKNNILTEISAGAVGQMLEPGEEILQLNYNAQRDCMSPLQMSPTTIERDTEGHADHNFSASLGGPYSVRSEAFAQAQSMTANVCQRAAKGTDSESSMHPLSTSGQLMMSMWTKYSGALAHDLMATPINETDISSCIQDQPPVVVIVSADRIAAAALQTLLVEGTFKETFKSPNLRECLPRSVRDGLAVEMFEVHDALGLLGKNNTTGATLVQKLKGGAPLDKADLEKLASAPSEDTLLLEMIPDETSVPTVDCLLGLDNIAFTERWETRYEYHKQFLSRRDLYREGQILVLTSPLHAMHLDELKESYPNLYVVSIESDAREKWVSDAHDMCKIINRSQLNESAYVDNWMTLHSEVVSSIRKIANDVSLEGRFLNITSQQLSNAPLASLNMVLGLIRNELVTGKQLSMVPMIELIAKYQSQHKLIKAIMQSSILSKSYVMDILDFLFIGQSDRSGEPYFRGNRLIKYGLDTYNNLISIWSKSKNYVMKAAGAMSMITN